MTDRGTGGVRKEKDVFSYEPIGKDNYLKVDRAFSVPMSNTWFRGRWKSHCLSTHVLPLIKVTGSGPEVNTEKQQESC